MKYNCKCGAIYFGKVAPPFCMVCGLTNINIKMNMEAAVKEVKQQASIGNADYFCKGCGKDVFDIYVPCTRCGGVVFVALKATSAEPQIKMTFDGVMKATYVSPLAALLTENSWAGNVFRAPPMEERLVRADRAIRNDAEISMNATHGLDPRSLELALGYSAYLFLSEMADEACEELTRCRS